MRNDNGGTNAEAKIEELTLENEKLHEQLLEGAGHAIAPQGHPSGGGLGSGRGTETGMCRLLAYWLDTYLRDKAYRVPTLTLSQAMTVMYTASAVLYTKQAPNHRRSGNYPSEVSNHCFG